MTRAKLALRSPIMMFTYGCPYGWNRWLLPLNNWTLFCRACLACLMLVWRLLEMWVSISGYLYMSTCLNDLFSFAHTWGIGVTSLVYQQNIGCRLWLSHCFGPFVFCICPPHWELNCSASAGYGALVLYRLLKARCNSCPLWASHCFRTSVSLYAFCKFRACFQWALINIIY